MKSSSLPVVSLASLYPISLLALAVVTMFGLSGCQPPTAKVDSKEDAHAHHDHDAHGPHGGHMIHLEPSGSHAEWTHDDDAGKLAIHLEEVEEFGKKVDSVKVELELKGEPKKTYDFTSAGKGVYELVSPELLTAIEVGSGDKDKVSAKLVISIDGKEETVLLEHHDHHH